MRTAFVFLICAVVISSCGDGRESSDAARTTLRIGTDATYPPFETVDIETGELQGFDIDLITEVCQTSGWEPEFIVTPFDGIIPGLTGKKYDAVISAMTITPRRAVVVDFSDPYYLAGQVIAVPLEDSAIFSVDDLSGKKVGVQLGTTGEIMAKSMDGLHVYSFDNIGAAFIDIANGNLDAILNDCPTTQAYIKRQGTAKTVGQVLTREHYGIAVRKGESELLTAINGALREIRKSGRYEQIYRKWFGEPPPEDPSADTTAASDSL